MFYAKAMIKPSLEVVTVVEIDFWLFHIRYWDLELWMKQVPFEDVVWIELDNKGRKKI